MKKITAMLILLSMIASSAVVAGDGGYQVGDKVSDFKLKNVDGSWVSLSDYPDAKGFIVMFTCNHCPYVIAYEDRIIDLNKKYAPLGYPVIAINPNDATVSPGDSFEGMQQRAKDKGFAFPYLYDEQQKVYPVFGATRTPHVYILSKKDGDMFVEYIGTIDNNYEDDSKVTEKYVESAVNALLDGKKPLVTNTRAIGCTIKVKK